MPSPSERATEIVKQRGEQYGSPTPIAATTAELWNAWLGVEGTDEVIHTIEPLDVEMMMALHKIARQRHRHQDDNLTDICGYINVYDKVRLEEE